MTDLPLPKQRSFVESEMKLAVDKVGRWWTWTLNRGGGEYSFQSGFATGATARRAGKAFVDTLRQGA